jgi:hypothetical protein
LSTALRRTKLYLRGGANDPILELTGLAGRRPSHQPKVALMTPLADAVLDAATAALARHDASPLADGPLRQRREDARAVAVAVLVAVGGAKGRPGMLPFTNGLSQKFLALADELDAEDD